MKEVKWDEASGVRALLLVVSLLHLCFFFYLNVANKLPPSQAFTSSVMITGRH